jgi:hypothetical protein
MLTNIHVNLHVFEVSCVFRKGRFHFNNDFRQSSTFALFYVLLFVRVGSRLSMTLCF